MKIKIKKVLSALALLALSAGFAQAEMIIGINLTESTGTDADMTTTDLAGAPGVRDDYWNNLAAANNKTLLGADATYNDGTTVGGTFQVTLATDRAGFIAATTKVNDAMMYHGGTTLRDDEVATFTLTGIPFANYAIYAYSGDPGGTARGGYISVGSTSYYQRDDGTGAVSNAADDGTGYVAMTTTSLPVDTTDITWGNYAYFGGLSGTSQTVTYSTLTMPGSNARRFNVTGIQIVEVVPEPSSILLLLCGFMALKFRIYRRR